MKNPSIALSKTTTLSSASVSIAVMSALSCGFVSGPKMWSGGSLIVTRQYAGVRRVRRICLSLIHIYSALCLAQRFERRAKFRDEEFRLFPRREVPAFGQLVVID